MKRKERRGVNFTISEELFNDIMAKALGFEPGSIQVLYVTNEHWNRAFEFTVVSNDERFPVVEEGRRFPRVTPILESVKVESEGEESTRYEVRFKGFDTTE